MNFIRRTPLRLMLSGGTITNPRGHRPAQSRPFPTYGVGGSPVGGRGPPGGVTGQALRARLGGAARGGGVGGVGRGVLGPRVSAPLPVGGAVELPPDQPAVPSPRHEISSALR